MNQTTQNQKTRILPAFADTGQGSPPPSAQLPPRVGAPLPGRPRNSSGGSNGCIVAAAVGAVVMVGMVIVMGIVAAIMLPALSRGREAARRASCQNNLKQMGLVYLMFSNEHDHYLPHLSEVPGEFAPRASEIYPEYLASPEVMICPSDPSVPASPDSPSAISDESYFYLGYAITNEAEAQSFVDAYRQQRDTGGAFDEDLIAGAGAGTGGTDRIFRLRDSFDGDLPVRSDQIPIMFDRDLNHHIPGGINVLYLDGHVEFVKEGEFPAQQWFLDALAALG